MTSTSADRPDDPAAGEPAPSSSAQGADADSGLTAGSGSGQGSYQPPQDAGYQQAGYQQAGYSQGGYQPPAQGYQQPAYGQQPGQYAPPPANPNQPGYPPQPYVAPPAGQQPMSPQPMSQSDERLWATLSHISIPFFGVIGPLIVYLVFKDRSAFLKDQGAESLNFSILYTIAQVVSSFLTVLVIGAVLLPLIFVAALVLCIMAAIAANKGELYRYPVNWRLIK